MRKIPFSAGYLAISLALTLALASASAALAAGREDAYRSVRQAAMDSRAKALYEGSETPAAGEGPGAPLVIIIVPAFDFAAHGAIEGTVGDVRLKSRKGRSEAASLTFMAQKPLGAATLGFFYQLAYGSYSGGLMVPASGGPPGFSFDGWSDVRVVSNVAGITADFQLGALGKLETAFLGAFESYGGMETMTTPNPAHPLDSRRADSFQDRVASITGFWSKDFQAGPAALTPYVGWRSVKVTLINQTDWPNGGFLPDSSSWAHLGAAGVKGVWHLGRLSVTGRLGVNHRFSKSDIPGWASRAMAPGVTHLGWQVGWDKTVASWGLGVGWVIPGTMILDFGYNGQAGGDTSAHTLSAGLIFPF